MLKSEKDNYKAKGLVMPNGRRQTKVQHCLSSSSLCITVSCTIWLCVLFKWTRSFDAQVRKSMCRIKYVMYERARAETDAVKSEQLKRFVNNL